MQEQLESELRSFNDEVLKNISKDIMYQLFLIVRTNLALTSGCTQREQRLIGFLADSVHNIPFDMTSSYELSKAIHTYYWSNRVIHEEEMTGITYFILPLAFSEYLSEEVQESLKRNSEVGFQL